jgi:hypothetical protein
MRRAALGDRRTQPLRRLRWRLRGAWLWPTFAAVTLTDTVLLHLLPLAGDDGTGWVPAFLLAGCLNVVAIAGLGGLGGWLLRRRRRDLPKVVADDYAGTALVLAVAVAFLVVGLVHRQEVLADRDDFAAQAMAARAYVEAQAPAEYRRNVDAATTLRIDDTLYRTCIPGSDPNKWLCLYIDTSSRPATARRDTNPVSNERFNPVGGFR